jgi:hypothetical protein
MSNKEDGARFSFQKFEYIYLLFWYGKIIRSQLIINSNINMGAKGYTYSNKEILGA